MTDAIALAAPQSDAAETFALAVHAETSRLSLYVRDRGVTLTGGEIGWTIGERRFSLPLSRLEAIHLETDSMRSGPLPVCKLSFNLGSPLRIVACSRQGFPDLEQDRVYRAFLEALHHRLTADDRARISFTYGCPESRLRRMEVAICLSLIVLTVLFLVLLFTHRLKALLMLIGAAGTFWRIKTAVEAHAPKPYDPDNIPSAMLGMAEEPSSRA